MFLSDMSVKAVRNAVEEIFADAADEAVGLHLIVNALQLVTKLTEGINDQT